MDARELEKQRLEFFADVAQTEDPEALSTGEKMVLLERFERLFPEARTDPPNPIHNEALGLRREASTDEVVWARLRHLRALAQKRIVEVVDGGYVTMTDSFSWSMEMNRWEVVQPLALEGRYYNEIVRLTRPPEPFRFRRCPNCERIFCARRSNMKYCSADCTRSANENARRDAKRDWNREYMRERRSSKKENS